MPKKETKKLVITLLLADMLLAGIFAFLFYFTKGMIDESITVSDEIKTELKKEETRTLMKDDLLLGKMYKEKLRDYMIQSGGTVDFIKILEQLVSNSGLKSDVKSVTNEAYARGESIGDELIRVNMDVLGEWKNVQFFLKSLENYPLKIEIKKVSLNKFSVYTINGRNIPEWSGNIEFTVVKIKDTK